MKSMNRLFLFLVLSGAMSAFLAAPVLPEPSSGSADPPFSGTVYFDEGALRPIDPTVFRELENRGMGRRLMFDRRVDDWVTLNAFLFQAFFNDGLEIEVQVNPEFGSVDAAREEAGKFMYAVGQLPTILRKQVKTIWIHEGRERLGGGNDNILIYSDSADQHIRNNTLEEALFHEATHSSIDAMFENDEEWLDAQKADGGFISDYARAHPNREDVAESLLPAYVLIRFPERLSEATKEKIARAMPNRMKLFGRIFSADQSIFIDQSHYSTDQETCAVELDPSYYYRLTNDYLGDGRSLDTYADRENHPFMAESGGKTGQAWRLTPLGDGYYRLTNKFLGRGRSLDTYSDGRNDPFMAETSDSPGQRWKLTSLCDGHYWLTNQFLGDGRFLDTYSSQENDPFMATTGNKSGQRWRLSAFGRIDKQAYHSGSRRKH